MSCICKYIQYSEEIKRLHRFHGQAFLEGDNNIPGCHPLLLLSASDFPLRWACSAWSPIIVASPNPAGLKSYIDIALRANPLVMRRRIVGHYRYKSVAAGPLRENNHAGQPLVRG